ncbi:chromosome segregation protein SMC [Pendulispora albinea]|uniref:Chromosome partition protein Smc n=1 Tax=Pendulispora albinea TaxID=2741071 RepID=A0ABZ2M974_9BACT
MKIKKLEMVGFKSFVDRTVVHFDHDVMGIVGPNGCGKSNIVDAIRWCMGEQSAKHLRGKAMEDVIFSGSESRPANEFAEVTLTFENDTGDVPLEYKDFPEIAVTRRLHRNGDSDYMINKTDVRLKDVTDLFLGTGVGTKAYSIIEQGKIGLIVSAKPEDRRLLIEEAAGITKYKSKKKQAERKMEMTQQNLLRVGDIVAEIERNLGSLKRQAAKAERFIAYRREVEDLQLYEASHRYLELTGWIKLEAGEVERFLKDSEEARVALAAREAELETFRVQMHTAEEELERAQNKNFGAENEARAEEAAIARAQDKLEGLRQRDEKASAEEREVEAQWQRVVSERETVTQEVAESEGIEETHASLVGGEEDQLAELVASHNEAEQAVKSLRQRVSQAQANIASAEAKLAGTERRKSEMQTRLDKVVAERERLEGERLEQGSRTSRLEQEIADHRQGKELGAEEQVQLEARLEELKAQIASGERSLEEAKNELARKRSRLHALEDMLARLEGVGAGVKALVATKDPALCGLVADRVEAPAELTLAVAGWLGGRLHDVVVEDADRGLELLGDLAAQKKGRAVIVPRAPRRAAASTANGAGGAEGALNGFRRLVEGLRYAAEDEALVRSLFGDTLVASDIAEALRMREALGEAPVAIVTLGGTVFFPDGRIAGGTGEDVAAGMLDTKRETRELAEEVPRLEARVAELVEEHQALRIALGETQGALDSARHRAHQDELSLVRAEKDLRALEGQLETIERRLEALAIEVSDLGSALSEADDERSETQRLLDEANTLHEEGNAQLGESEALAESWRERVDMQRQVLTEKKVQLAGAREKLTAARATLSRLERSAQELEERRVRLQAEIQECARAAGETGAVLVAHREKFDAAQEIVRAAAEELARNRAEVESLRVVFGELEGLLKDLRAAADLAREELGRHEMGLRERRLAMTHLLDGVSEKFRGLELGRVVGDYHMRPPPDEETHNRISELVTLIERMGSVNLDAVREHAEAEKRFEFYSTQKADLEKALSDLQLAIQQMNKESKRLFADTFQAVKEKFEATFPVMFRGGRASLRLTNPEDMLETGIDIIAQPPGKKVSSIELMSGGEKALTAVSLIFAIFQIKPSPFCILDEVDAPLDEANVARYNEMIRNMTDRSQFILITHIKRTMQMVDVLYGVTMQESGVSRLVSVKMNESAEKRQRPGMAATEGNTAAVA